KYIHEKLFYFLFLIFTQSSLFFFPFIHQLIHGLTVHTDESHLIPFIFQRLDKMIIEHLVHEQYIISIISGRTNITILILCIKGIDRYFYIIFVGMVFFYFIKILLYCKIFIFRIFQKSNIFYTIIKFILTDHPIFDKYSDILPFTLKFLPILLEQFL